MLQHSNSEHLFQIGVSNSNPELIQSDSSKQKHSSIVLSQNIDSQNIEEGSKEIEADFDIFVDDQARPEINFDEFEQNITSPP